MKQLNDVIAKSRKETQVAKNPASRVPGDPKWRSDKSVDDPVGGYKLAESKRRIPQVEPAPMDDEVLDRHMGRAIGGESGARAFRDEVGEDIYEKLATGKPLTAEETNQAERAFQGADKERPKSAPSDLSQRVAAIAKSARDETKWHATKGVDDNVGGYEVGKLPPQRGPAPTEEDIFEKHMGQALGGPENARAFRAQVGDDLHDRLATDGTSGLSIEERDAPRRSLSP
jgi:hypothetical protein